MDVLKKLSEKNEPCSEEECCGEGTVYKDGKCVTLIKDTYVRERAPTKKKNHNLNTGK